MGDGSPLLHVPPGHHSPRVLPGRLLTHPVVVPVATWGHEPCASMLCGAGALWRPA